MIILNKKCFNCNKTFILSIPSDEYEKYNSDVNIQNAIPSLSADERELMISGMCGECYDKLFDDMDE